MRFHFGVVWDTYTPAVEARFVRDLIAMMNARSNIELICCSQSGMAERVLRGMQIPRVPILALATLWLQYRVGAEWPDVPEHASIIVQRDLHVKTKPANIDPSAHPGYTLPDLGRDAPARTFRMPNPEAPAMVDPMFLIWQNFNH